jgi:hypothetical protein
MSQKLTLKKLINVKCSEGRVGSVLSEIQKLIEIEVGEFFDVLCVALRKKKLAALDFSAYGKKHLRKMNVKLINEIIDFANQNDVRMLHNKKRGGMYLKTIFYYPSQKNNAYKLAYILWGDFDARVVVLHYMIGSLLGYSEENIQKFFLQNFGATISSNSVKMIRTKLKELKNYKDWILDQIERKQVVARDSIELL